MSIRTNPTGTVILGIVVLVSAAALAQPALEQADTRDMRTGFDRLPWLGCWDVIPEAGDEAQEPRVENQTICVEPGSAPHALKMIVRIDGRAAAEETVVPDGSWQPVSDGGCDGWIRSIPSQDRRRIYLQSEATCADGSPRQLSGASMIVSGVRWIDIHALRVDGVHELLIQRYRPVEADIPRLPGALPSASHAARLDAAAPLAVDDVLEALRVVDPAVVEAMLLEGDARFGVDSDLLLRLADADVPGEVIDLMVAMSFPEHFSVEAGEISREQEVYYGGYWSPWYPYYGYGHYYYHRYAHHDGNRGGKVVSGRGFVRVQQTDGPPGGLGGFVGAGPGAAGGVGAFDGSHGGTPGGGSASGSGYQSGNSSSTRPAIPK